MSDQPRVVVIVQARLGSIRLPGKVLAPVLDRPLLANLLARLGRASRIDQVVLAVPDTPANDPLADLGTAESVTVFRGSELDVLDRYHQAASESAAEIVVRITGDCPLVDPSLVDTLVGRLITSELDYVHTGEGFPDGFDVEVCTFDSLATAAARAVDRADREHVTRFLRTSGQFRCETIESQVDLGHERVTVDEPEDLEVIKAVFETFGHNEFTFDDVAALMGRNPRLFGANRGVRRNDGAATNSGQKLWQRAKHVIPGGNMLLSKRSEMHLPGRWPTYFSRAQGCTVWDLDGQPFTDVGLMGVGTNILGYAHPKVDEAVRRVVDTGNLSTLNCPEEVELAERLVALHPWSDMARLTRAGGEACAVATRIARAASGRDVIAFCGYHGWHDWFLATSLDEGSALDAHLLPGLEPAGVPRRLAGSAVPFEYNDLQSLEKVLAGGDVGAVFMEVQRLTEPMPGFLEGVRALATRYGAVLVFDECTSGFRKNLGGLHLVKGVDPDIAVFGKTLGNGYAINAVIGRREVMEHAQDSFISSTFWTERIGPAAALATLKVMRSEDAPARIDAIGREVQGCWAELARSAGLEIHVQGIPALASFQVTSHEALVAKTYITQELLEKGYLGGTLLYASIAHEPSILDGYLDVLGPVFDRVASTPAEDLVTMINGQVCDGGFRRLV